LRSATNSGDQLSNAQARGIIIDSLFNADLNRSAVAS
jgi:hypothetical protein